MCISWYFIRRLLRKLLRLCGKIRNDWLRWRKSVIIVYRPFVQDNLVEKKHHRLSRSARSDVLDRELKPNAK